MFQFRLASFLPDGNFGSSLSFSLSLSIFHVKLPIKREAETRCSVEKNMSTRPGSDHPQHLSLLEAKAERDPRVIHQVVRLRLSLSLSLSL